MQNRFFLLLLVWLGACTNPQAQQSSDTSLSGEWSLLEMDGTKASDNALYQKFTLHFDGEKLSGKAANRFSISAEQFADGHLRVGHDILSTRMRPLGRNAFLEQRYFDCILSLTHWQQSQQRLTLTGEQCTLTFIANTEQSP